MDLPYTEGEISNFDDTNDIHFLSLKDLWKQFEKNIEFNTLSKTEFSNVKKCWRGIELFKQLIYDDFCVFPDEYHFLGALLRKIELLMQ